MTRSQRITLLNYLRAKGFHERPATAARTQSVGSDAQHRLIRVLWIKLHQAGKVHDPSETALNAFVKRMSGIERVEWLYSRKANVVIEALKAWLAREGK